MPGYSGHAAPAAQEVPGAASTRHMQIRPALTDRDAEARLILVGDVRQLGSVGAGRAFAQLQENGMATAVLDQIVRQTNDHTREAVEAMLAGEAARAFDAIDKGGGRIVEHPDDDQRHALIARDFAALSPQARAATLVLDPTREGRHRLTDAIRAALVNDGTLGKDAVSATVLQARDLTRAEAANAASYAPGQRVTFRRGSREQRLSKGIGYTVDAVDADSGTVALVSPKGRKITWLPARWGGDQAKAFDDVPIELRTGDQVQFTRYNRRAGRNNGDIAAVPPSTPTAAASSSRRPMAPDRRSTSAGSPIAVSAMGGCAPSTPPRCNRQSCHRPSGVVPRQYRRCRLRIRRHQPSPRSRRALYRQPG